MIIAFFGNKGCGKTTAAEYLMNKHGFTLMSFAKPLKLAALHIFGLNVEQLYGGAKDIIDKRLGVTPRKVLQVIGTELFQYDIHKHIPGLKIPERGLWVWNMKRRILQEMERQIRVMYGTHILELGDVKNCPDVKIVIDDLRFPHEAEMIKELGGKIVRIREDRNYENDNHASETEMESIKVDTGLVNDKTAYKSIFKFHMLVDTILRYLEGKLSKFRWIK